MLAISWEPAFCEDHEGKSECQRETEQSFDATHFSLHGLWPQPNGNFYCHGVDRTLKEADKRNHWFELPEPDLDAATRDRLAAVMPGVLSGLERHEWIKHGTCFGGEANAYFNRAAGLAEQVNASPVRALFASKIGQSVTSAEIRAAFDKGFGEGAGARVEVHCLNGGDGRNRRADHFAGGRRSRLGAARRPDPRGGDPLVRIAWRFDRRDDEVASRRGGAAGGIKLRKRHMAPGLAVVMTSLTGHYVTLTGGFLRVRRSLAIKLVS